MSRDALLVGACIGAVIGAVLTFWLGPYATPPLAPIHQPRLSKDQVQLVVEGEFTLHHQDCVLFSIYTHRNEDWEKRVTSYECGHGLIPSNPLPPDGGTSDDDWEWEEFVNATTDAHPNGG